MEIKVAVFEDNTDLRNSLECLINNTDELVCTGAFANANKLARDMKYADPDVVMMDIKMPGVSGISAVETIKASYPSVKIIMQTVFEDSDKIFAAVCAGANGYLLKNINAEKIIEAIRETFAGGAPMTGSVAALVLKMMKSQSNIEKNEFIELSEREKQILALLVGGKSYKAIAATCFISVATVSTHVAHIYNKLHVHSKSAAVAKAINHKLV